MHELKLSGSHLAGLMQVVLEKDACFRYRARGQSMSPFIRDKDILTLFPLGSVPVRLGEVAAALRPETGTVIVHRLVGRKGAGFILKGDNCHAVDGLFGPERVLGVVRIVERKGQRAWFCGGPERRLIALLSRFGVLNRLLLPFLRKARCQWNRAARSGNE
jgi:hypothetical protein